MDSEKNIIANLYTESILVLLYVLLIIKNSFTFSCVGVIMESKKQVNSEIYSVLLSISCINKESFV